MRIFIKSLRILAKSCAVLFGLAVALYLAAVAVNWNDQPPSETALEFEDYYANRKPIPDEDNAFAYASGFGVREGENPTEMGAKRIAWNNQNAVNSVLDFDTDPINTKRHVKPDRSEGVRKLFKICVQANRGCLNAMESNPAALAEWLESEQPLLDRY